MTAATAKRPRATDDGYVTDDDCQSRCGTIRWIIGTILLGVSIILISITYVWAGTRAIEQECETASKQFGLHQAAEAERDKAMEQRLERWQEQQGVDFDRLEGKLDKISLSLQE